MTCAPWARIDGSHEQRRHEQRDAAEHCRSGGNPGPRHSWLPMLQRALTACDDLACAAHW